MRLFALMIAILTTLPGGCINADSEPETFPSIFPSPEAAWSVGRCGALYEDLRWDEERCMDDFEGDKNTGCFTLTVDSNEFDQHCGGGLLLDELPPTPWAQDECEAIMLDNSGPVWFGCTLSGKCSGRYGQLVRLWNQQCR